MLYVMTAEVFGKCVEPDEKLMKRAVVYRYNSTYVLKDPMETTKNMFEISKFSCDTDENFFMGYLINDEEAIKFRLMMAYETFSGLNVFILVYQPEEFDTIWLWTYLDFFTKQYGIVPRLAFDIQDFNTIPKDYDEFSIVGLYNYKQDQNKTVELIKGLIQNSDATRQVAFEQLRKSEVLL